MAVLVVAYNAVRVLSLTQKVLDSVLSSNYPNFKAFVLDNGSNDRTFDLLNDKYGSQILLLRSQRNLGFAGGNDFLFRMVPHDTDYIVVQNSTTVIEPDSIRLLVEQIEKNPSWGAVSGVISFLDSPRVATAGSIVDILGNEYSRYGLCDTSEVSARSYVTHVAGAFGVFRNRALNHLLFQHGFFTNHEDNELGMRLWRNGWKVAVLPFVAAHHNWGTIRGHVNSQLRRKLEWYTGRNTFAVRRRYLMDDLFLRRYFWMLSCYGLTGALSSAITGSKSFAAGYFSGLFDSRESAFSSRNLNSHGTFSPLLIMPKTFMSAASLMTLSYSRVRARNWSPSNPIALNISDKELECSQRKFIVRIRKDYLLHCIS